MELIQSEGIGCLLMAAGSASRFGQNKLLTPFREKPLVQWALESIPAERFSQVTVVTRYPEIEKMAGEYGFACIRNEHPEWGASYTIRLGTEAMQDCRAILYLVADQPLLDVASVERILETWRSNPCSIVAAAHRGKTGNPCIFPREFFGQLMELEGDTGGKQVIRRHPDKLCTVELTADELADCDTPAQLQELDRQAKSN